MSSVTRLICDRCGADMSSVARYGVGRVSADVRAHDGRDSNYGYVGVDLCRPCFAVALPLIKDAVKPEIRRD